MGRREGVRREIKALESAAIPERWTLIDDVALRCWGSLASIMLAGEVVAFGGSAFCCCRSLVAMLLSPG
jgi:hypothetical protein